MRRGICWWAAGFGAVAWAAALQGQSPPPKLSNLHQDRLARDAQIDAQLAAHSPKAATLFGQANELSSKGDYAGAAALYRLVTQLVPSSDAALRRAGGAELAQGHRAEAISLLRRALVRSASADNLTSLAVALSASHNGIRPTESDVEEAAKDAADAVRLAPLSYWAWIAQLDVQAAKGNLDGALSALNQLQRIGPTEPSTWVYAVAIHAAREEWAAASEGTRDRAPSGPRSGPFEVDL
jgi:tetratricopeptide (TPR) repeat protein